MQVVTQGLNCMVVALSTMGAEEEMTRSKKGWEVPLGRCCLKADGWDKGGDDNVRGKWLSMQAQKLPRVQSTFSLNRG